MMGKKLLMLAASLALLAIGIVAGVKFSGDNRATVVGDTSRYTAATRSAGQLTRSVGGSGTGTVHEVRAGGTIQAAVAAASEGDVIEVYPGVYKETVYIDKDDLVISGRIQDGAWPIMEGDAELNDAILYSGNDITIENLQIQHYKGNAIMGQAGNNFLIRNNHIIDTGVYGIFPEFGTNGLITHNVLSGIEDAAIYVGMCDNIHVTNNEVFDNVAGIEIENTRHSIVENNYVHDNTGGILVFITPGLPIKTTYDTIVRNNFIVNNNTPNFGIPGSTVSGIPAGTGILNMAGDQTTIEGNVITGNKTIGILITDHMNAPNVILDPGADPNSDEIAILDNLMWNNGYDTIPEIRALQTVEFVDGDVQILNIGASANSCILDHDKYVTVGLKDFGTCGFSTTADVVTYLLEEPAERRVIAAEDMGKRAYYGICAGCHSYNIKMIGPPTQIIQALYLDNPQGIVDYITNPVKKRDDYPEMPPQNYLSEEVRMAAAEYMLQVEN
jgi:parallel beta-helix repeat protein